MAPMVTLAPSVTHSDDKGRKFMDIVGTAYDKAKLPEDEAQNVNAAPGLAEVVAGFIADNRSSNKNKKEEVKPRWPYPASYKREAIERQMDILRSAANFPFIDPDPAIKYYREVYGSLRQPEWVEGPISIAAPSTSGSRSSARRVRSTTGVQAKSRRIVSGGKPATSRCTTGSMRHSRTAT